MNATATPIQVLAAEAATYFESAARPDATSFVRVKDAAPEWVKDIVRAAHDNFLPDDWRYDKIQDALEYIAEADDPEDSAEFADEAVDIYTGDRIAWLASNLNRAGYCDEAAAEFGGGDTGSDIVAMIGQGQYFEASQIYGLVLEALEAAVSAEVES